FRSGQQRAGADAQGRQRPEAHRGAGHVPSPPTPGRGPGQAEDSPRSCAYDGVMSRIAITAFSGWNDAGEAATGVIEHLHEVWPTRAAGAVDAEEFIDFQVNRPEIRTTEDGRRTIEWPDTRLHLVTPPRGPEIVTVLGPEPSLHWKRFCDEVLEQLQLLDVSSVISLGALLADSPHSRPLPVSAHVEPVPAQPVDGSDLYSGPIG